MQCFPSAASIQTKIVVNSIFPFRLITACGNRSLSLRHCKHTHTHTRSDVAARSSRKSSYRGTILPLKMRNPSPPRVLCSIRKIHFHTHKLKRSGLAHRHSSARKTGSGMQRSVGGVSACRTDGGLCFSLAAPEKRWEEKLEGEGEREREREREALVTDGNGEISTSPPPSSHSRLQLQMNFLQLCNHERDSSHNHFLTSCHSNHVFSFLNEWQNVMQWKRWWFIVLSFKKTPQTQTCQPWNIFLSTTCVMATGGGGGGGIYHM